MKLMAFSNKALKDYITSQNIPRVADSQGIKANGLHNMDPSKNLKSKSLSIYKVQENVGFLFLVFLISGS